MRRRDVLIGSSGVATAALAGCLGAIGMDEHEASPAGVDPETLDDTGYEFIAVDEMMVTETFERAGYSETVRVTNYLTEYEKSVSLGPLGSLQAASFVVLTTPQVSLAGQEFNPIQEMDSQELVELVAENYDDVDSIEHDRDSDVSILDQDTVEARFSADARFDGHEFPVYIHISESVQTADDHLVTIGVYPQEVAGDEEDNVVAMMESAIEDAEQDAGGDDGDLNDDGDSDGAADDGDGSRNDAQEGSEDDEDQDDGVGL